MKVQINDNAPVLHGGLRYSPGETYNVDTETGGLFKGQGWAESADKGAEVSEPFVCHEATDEDAERFEAEARERASRAQGGTQEPDLDVQDGVLGSESSF